MSLAHMRRMIILALIVCALIAFSTVHLSKGEPLPTPKSILVWYR